MLRMVLESSTMSTRLGIRARTQPSTNLRASSRLIGWASATPVPSPRGAPTEAASTVKGDGCTPLAASMTMVFSFCGRDPSITQISTPPCLSAAAAASASWAENSMGTEAMAAPCRQYS